MSIQSSDVIFLSGANQQIGTHQNLQAFDLENMMIEGVKVLLSIILTRWIINVKIQETIMYDCFKEHLEFFLVFAGGRQNSPSTRQHKQRIIQLYCTIHRNLYWSISSLHYFILACWRKILSFFTPWSLQFDFADCSCIRAENGRF